jgi:4'-phosphopantetheinyl transferase
MRAFECVKVAMGFLVEWGDAPSSVFLEEGAVHVWGWDFDCSESEFLRYASLLSVEELVRQKRFLFKEDRVRYTVCHGIVRILLGNYLGLDPTSLEFTQNKFGRTSVRLQLIPYAISFNLSHTRGLALLAVAKNCEVGVDVEELSPVEAEIADRYFSDKERLELDSLVGSTWLEGFYRCWTRKEAILKAEGIGLNVKLDAFSVSLGPREDATLREFQSSSGITRRWHLAHLQPAPGFVGALAVSIIPRTIACFRFRLFQ